MAEALAIIGIIANIIALVDFGAEIYDRAQSFGEDVKDVPKAFRHVRDKLPLVKRVLEKTQERASSGEIGEDDSKALQPSLSGCLKNIKDLNAIFNEVLPPVGSSRWTRGWKAVSSLGQDKKIQAIDKALMDNVDALTFYQSSEGATVAQVTEAIKSLNVKAEEPARKPLFMVRYQKEEEFIGRKAIMEDIERRFETSSRRVAIAGIGGVGKSRIAIEYCYQYRTNNPTTDVFWVHGGTKARLEAAYEEIAGSMKIPGLYEPNVDTLKLVSDWLSEDSNGPWLMVLDNVDDAEIWTSPGHSSSPDSSSQLSFPLASYLPRGSHGDMLITTRNIQIGKTLTRKKPIEVPILGSEEAVALLRSRILDDQVTDEDAKSLTESLGFLPLAVTQAAAYLDQNEIEVARYLELVRTSDADTSDLLSRENHDESRDPEIQNAVFQTWKISFDQISHQAPRAAEALSLMAMLDRQAISADLLRYQEEKDLDFIQAMQKLKSYSLIVEESREKTYSLHRIVQLSIRWHLESRNEVQYWQEKALCSVGNCLPSDGNYEHWRSIEALNPHAQIVLNYECTKNALTSQQAKLMLVLGCYHGGRGFKSVAIENLSNSVELYEKNADSDKADLLEAMSNLAFFLGETDQLGDAEKMICSALEISEQAFPENPNSRLLCVWALILSYQKKHSKAEDVFQQALDLYAVRDKLSDSTYMEIRHNLALLYADQGQFSKAESLYREVCNDELIVFGENHPDTLVTMECLADVLGSQDKFEEQEQLARKVFLLRSKELGSSNPMTLRSMHKLASAVEDVERFEEAESLARDTLRLRKEFLGSEHDDTLNTMHTLAHVLSNQGKLTQSEELYRETLNLRKKVFGIENADTLGTMHNLAGVLSDLERYDEAEECYRKTLKLRTEVLGFENADTLGTMHRLAGVLDDLERYDEAEECYRATLRLRAKVLGADHKSTLLTLYNLAYTLKTLGKYYEAKKVAEKCLGLNNSVFGPEHSESIDAKNLLAGIFSKIEMGTEGREMEGQAKEESEAENEESEGSGAEGEEEFCCRIANWNR